MKTTAVELNPQVLAVCRSWFKLPPDSSTLQVVLADAAQESKSPNGRARSMHWQSICTTMKRRLPCSTAPSSMPIAAIC
jgi:hypothetical protein